MSLARTYTTAVNEALTGGNQYHCLSGGNLYRLPTNTRAHDNTKHDKTDSPPALPRHSQRINPHPLRSTAPIPSPPRPCPNPQSNGTSPFHAISHTLSRQPFASRTHSPICTNTYAEEVSSSPLSDPTTKPPPGSQMPSPQPTSTKKMYHSRHLIRVPSICAVRKKSGLHRRKQLI